MDLLFLFPNLKQRRFLRNFSYARFCHQFAPREDSTRTCFLEGDCISKVLLNRWFLVVVAGSIPKAQDLQSPNFNVQMAVASAYQDLRCFCSIVIGGLSRFLFSLSDLLRAKYTNSKM
jgi:uncharacterized metal-binding protein